MSRLLMIQSKLQYCFHSRYRQSRLRDAILAPKSKKRAEQFVSDNKRFVLFLVPGRDVVNGGIRSICSIAFETKKLLSHDGISVAICTAYGEPRMLRYTKFDNDFEILAFVDLLSRFPRHSEILIHVPEMFVQRFVADKMFVYRTRPDLNWRFNILLQNIDLIPPRQAVDLMQTLGRTTATIAHKAYATTETSRRLGCPIHYLSWWVCPEEFERVGYSDKQQLIIISPDPHTAKREIVHRISEALPDCKIIEIRNMPYHEFKNLIKYAKFSFTFGEGLDGYFIEEIFSGGVGMAIFNERFFTTEYRNLDGVFQDGDDAIMKVAQFLKATDNRDRYRIVTERQYGVLAKDFVREEYVQNIGEFYRKYCPEWRSMKNGVDTGLPRSESER